MILIVAGDRVSIAFRLSDELGLQEISEFTSALALKVSIAFRLSDELGHGRPLESSRLGQRGLNCLSAFGRIGTLSHFRPDFKRISSDDLHNRRFQSANKCKTMSCCDCQPYGKRPPALGKMQIYITDAIFGALVRSYGQATMAAGGSAGRTAFPARRMRASHAAQSG